MKWLRPRPSKKAIAVLAAIVVAEVGAATGIFVQQQASLARATALLEQKIAQRDEGARLASRLAMKDEQLRRDRDRLKFLEAGVPDAAYIPTMLRQLEGLARSTDNVVRGVRPQLEPAAQPTRAQRRSDPEADEKAAKNVPDAAKQVPEPYQRLRIQVNLTGTYPSAQRFIRQLNQFPKIVAVNGIVLRPRAGQGNSGSAELDVELNLTAFVLKEGAPPAPSHPAGRAAGAEEV